MADFVDKKDIYLISGDEKHQLELHNRKRPSVPSGTNFNKKFYDTPYFGDKDSFEFPLLGASMTGTYKD